MDNDTAVTAATAWGDAIREAREAAKLSQAQLAKKLSVDRSAVTLWEAGRTAPRAEMQGRLVDELDLDVTAIYAAMRGGARAAS